MKSLHRIIVTLATIALAIPLSAQGRNSPARPVAPGDTVRLHENRVVLVHGILLTRDSAGLVVADRRTRDTVHIPLFQITRAEVQRGSHRQGARVVGHGAAIGALIGGALLGLAITAPNQSDKGVGVFIAGVLAVATTGIGTAVGTIASFTGTETWLPFDPAVVALEGSNGPP